MLFYLGTHEPFWLKNLPGVPLFISRNRLVRLSNRKRSWPKACTRWALDSGGFTELSTHGRWTVPPATYIAEIRRARDEVGGLDWAAPQDWMCEPWIVAKTGLSVEEHQRRTVSNFLMLRDMGPDLPIIPVLQGWEADDYKRCADLYSKHGVDLTQQQTVGLGSVCRRQGTRDAVSIVEAVLSWAPLKLHGFGFKQQGAELAKKTLFSSDSMAWSRDARWLPPMEGCTHKSCVNCSKWALRWRDRLLAKLADPVPFLTHQASEIDTPGVA
jgi:hypothetical protein